MKNKIGFYPEDRLRKENTYFLSISKCLKNIGWKTVDYREIYKDPEVLIVDLNFFENITASNIFFAFLKFIKRIMIFSYIKLSRRKIIFTMHNKIAHDTKHPLMSSCLIKMQIKYADAIVALCSETKNILRTYNRDTQILDKLYLIPHPIYECNNKSIDLNKKSENNGHMKVLFVGQIRKYKNVEYILQLARDHRSDNVDFLVAGKAENDDYKRELLENAKDITNLTFRFGYLSEDEMTELIINSDLLIAPYNKVSTLNSGTLFLAFSLGTTCICPDIGSALEVHDKNAFYMYTYETEKEHYDNLNKIFSKAVLDYQKGKLQEKGKLCLKEVNMYNSLEKVKNGYQELLQNIINK